MKTRDLTFRLLTLLNAGGCLLLCGLVVAQWLKERAADLQLDAIRTELAASKVLVHEESGRRTALERDIEVLKESLGATQAAAEASARELGEQATHASALETELEAARAQLVTWEAALKARDERMATLAAELAATRKRLDEAVARLKAVR